MNEEKDTQELHESTDLFNDEMSSERAQNAKGTIWHFIKDLMKQKGKIFAVLICIIASAVFSIATPKLIGQAINQIYDGIKNAAATGGVFQVNIETMGGIMLTILGLYLLSILFSYIQQYVMAGISQKISLSMRESISEKLNRLPLRYYDTHKKGDILSRVTSDIEKVADTLQEVLPQLISSVVTIIGAFVMMLLISPLLTLIAFGTIIASVVIAAIISIRTRRYYAANQEALGDLNANIEEAFTGNTLIKAFNLQDEMTKTNDELNVRLRKTSTKAQFITYAVNPLVRLLGQIGYVIIAVRGALSVISGGITIGDIQALFQYVNQVSEPVTQLAFAMN
ncbi:MAG: ABC transporter ATP-binding protein, partial [Sporomusa sp.]